MNLEIILREEYWKHLEYYPCHYEIGTQQLEELKQLLAACATGECFCCIN